MFLFRIKFKVFVEIFEEKGFLIEKELYIKIEEVVE